MKMKKAKKFFRRKIILDKLAAVGDSSAEILLGLVMETLIIAKAMCLPPRQAQNTLRYSQTPRIETDIRSRMAFWTLLSKLKKEKLIAKNKSGRISITKRGAEYLRLKSEQPSWSKQYVPSIKTDEEIILVIFDIPEEVRGKRDWLRFHLARCGLRPLQKSVWWGESALPEELLKDIRKFNILPYIHVFSVQKEGTVSSVIAGQ